MAGRSSAASLSGSSRSARRQDWSGEEFYVNATRIEANAAYDSLRPRLAVAAARSSLQEVDDFADCLVGAFEEHAVAAAVEEVELGAGDALGNDAGACPVGTAVERGQNVLVTVEDKGG